MQCTISNGRRAVHATLVSVALLSVTACGGEDWRTPSGPAPTPLTTPPPPPAVGKDLGEYRLTMTAAPSCSLADYAMARTYNARLRESGQDLVVELDDQQHCVSWGWPCGFTGTRDAETVRFTFNGDYPGSDGYAFSYEVNGENMALAYKGAATGKMGDSSITAMLDGAVLLYACHGFCDDKEFARCDAPYHRMELRRK